MGHQEEQVERLMRLKRHESPREGYFEDFLDEFQSRQRQELLKKSSLELFAERFSTWFCELGTIKWVAGAGAAYAAIMLGVFLFLPPSESEVSPNLRPVSYQRDPADPLPAVDFESGKNFYSPSNTSREF
jgi:hypothetical protein